MATQRPSAWHPACALHGEAVQMWREVWATSVDATVQEVLPLGDQLLVAVNGPWLDHYSTGLGTRRVLFSRNDQPGGELHVLNADGSIRSRRSGLTPIHAEDNGFIALTTESNLVRCAANGIIELSQSLGSGTSAVLKSADRLLALTTDGPLSRGFASRLSQSTCTLYDFDLRRIADFSATGMVPQVLTREFIFGSETRSARISRADFHGNSIELAQLPCVPALKDGRIIPAGEGVFGYNEWVVSFDDQSNRVLVSSASPPHTVGCLDTDGRAEWFSTLGKWCCAGPVRRVRDAYVVATGCGDGVAWLGLDGTLLHHAHTEGFDPTAPSDVEPGPSETVFAARGDRVGEFAPGRDEQVVFKSDHRSARNVIWWPAVNSLVCWADTRITVVQRG